MATRAIDGYSCHETSRIASCVGLTTGCGGDGARITSRMYFGGWLYPEAVSAAFDTDTGFGEDGAACAAATTPMRQTNSAVPTAQQKGFRILIYFSPFVWTKLHGKRFEPHKEAKMRRCGREWPALKSLRSRVYRRESYQCKGTAAEASFPSTTTRSIFLAAARVEGSMRLDLLLAEADRVPEECSGYSRNRGRSRGWGTPTHRACRDFLAGKQKNGC